MNSKKISIIIPVYNDKRVEHAIQSVLKYKNVDMELIVIDGDSTDGTKEILEKMKNDIDIFVSEKDGSVSKACNKGRRLASGEWLFDLASDDILICDPMKIIEKYADETTDIICGNLIAKKGEKYAYNYSNPNLKLLDYQCSLRKPASFFRRSLYLQYGMADETLRCACDREIFLRFRIKGARFKLISEYIVIFSYGGLSTKNPIRYAYIEDLKISNKYRMNRLISISYFCYRCLMYFWWQIKGGIATLLKIERRSFPLSYEDISETIVKQTKALQNGN